MGVQCFLKTTNTDGESQAEETNDAEDSFTEEVGYCVRQSDVGNDWDLFTESSATTSDECKTACAEDISCIAAEFSSYGCYLW